MTQPPDNGSSGPEQAPDPFAPPPPGGPPPSAQPPYGQQPYGQQPYGQQPYGQPPAPYGGAELASWGLRVGSALIDYFVPFVVAVIVFRISTGLGVVLYLLALAWVIYNKVIEGRTGQSYGKQIVGTRLLAEATGQPVGPGLAIGRWLLHIVDGLPCYIGYLWPLWDAKKQTFADKLVHTVVIKA